MKFINDGCYHTLAISCVMGVYDDSDFHALSESNLISWHDMTCSIPLELHHFMGMLIYM